MNCRKRLTQSTWGLGWRRGWAQGRNRVLVGGPGSPHWKGNFLGGLFSHFKCIVVGRFQNTAQLHKIYDICTYRQLVASAIYWHSSLVDACLYLRKTAKTMYCASQQCKQRVMTSCTAARGFRLWCLLSIMPGNTGNLEFCWCSSKIL